MIRNCPACALEAYYRSIGFARGEILVPGHLDDCPNVDDEDEAE